MDNIFKILMVCFSLMGIFFLARDIKRDVYLLHTGECPLLIEFESLREAEETSFLPVTAFESCPGGICPVK